MQRSTARFLIVLLLVGILAPGALALAGSPLGSCCPKNMQSHACCMRKGHSGNAQQPQVSAQACGLHCGCNGAVTGRWAGFRGLTNAQFTPASVSFLAAASTTRASLQVSATHSGRAPPAIPLA
ncbi:MAG TPA: hypothetical protein VGF44_12870 [Terriglobales bacterium]